MFRLFQYAQIKCKKMTFRGCCFFSNDLNETRFHSDLRSGGNVLETSVYRHFIREYYENIQHFYNLSLMMFALTQQLS